jgi:hypothetical protein
MKHKWDIAGMVQQTPWTLLIAAMVDPLDGPRRHALSGRRSGGVGSLDENKDGVPCEAPYR